MVEFDEIGYWSEIKLEILRKYASAYSTILTSKKLSHVYVDAFAGAGQHISRATGEIVAGSPEISLQIEPPFKEYYWIDLDSNRVSNLRALAQSRPNVRIFAGNCNEILLEKVFPTLNYESYRRALCLLDPYGLDLEWNVIYQAGQLRTVDLFLNFPVMDMNRNILWRNPEKVPRERLQRLNRYWGDGSWRDVAYSDKGNLFGEMEKEPNEAVAEGFRKRLQEVAGFKRVPAPLPMRNKNDAVVYYLFFASQVGVAEDIITDIFDKYRKQ